MRRVERVYAGEQKDPFLSLRHQRGQFDATLDIVRKHLRRRRTRKVLVGAVNDSTALAVLQAFRETGLEKECAIVGQAASIEARQELRRPFTRLIGTVAYFQKTMVLNLSGSPWKSWRKVRAPGSLHAT